MQHNLFYEILNNENNEEKAGLIGFPPDINVKDTKEVFIREKGKPQKARATRLKDAEMAFGDKLVFNPFKSQS